MEAIIGKSPNTQGVWFRTNLRVDGSALLATTYCTVKGQPQVFSLRLELAPIVRFVEQYHDRLHGNVSGDCVGCGCVGAECDEVEIGKRKRFAKKLVRSKVLRGVFRGLRRATRKAKAPISQSHAALVFPVSEGALRAYKAAKALLEKSDGKTSTVEVGAFPALTALGVASGKAAVQSAKKVGKYGKKAFGKAFGKLLSKARSKGLLKKYGKKALGAIKKLAMKIATKKVQRVLKKAPKLQRLLQHPEVRAIANDVMGGGSEVQKIWAMTRLPGAEGVKARKAAAILKLVANHENRQKLIRQQVGAAVESGPLPVVGCVGCSYYSF